MGRHMWKWSTKIGNCQQATFDSRRVIDRAENWRCHNFHTPYKRNKCVISTWMGQLGCLLTSYTGYYGSYSPVAMNKWNIPASLTQSSWSRWNNASRAWNMRRRIPETVTWDQHSRRDLCTSKCVLHTLKHQAEGNRYIGHTSVEIHNKKQVNV